MLGYRRHRDDRTVHAWRALSRWIVACVLAIALVVPVPAMPAGAMPHEGSSGISVSFTASEQGAGSLSNHALVCHMHFEHHQLVRAENAVVMPALDSVRACYLTGVNSLTSLQPAPLRDHLALNLMVTTRWLLPASACNERARAHLLHSITRGRAMADAVCAKRS
jgi:hypothetical protein